MVTLFYKAKISKALLPVSIGLYIIGCLGCSYFGLGVKIPLLGELFRHPSFEAIRRIFLMGFPFFACGQLVLKLESKNVKSLPFFWLGAAVLFVAEIYLVSCLKLASNVIITAGLYILLLFTILLLLKHPLPQYEKAAGFSRTIANFTYYSHPLLMGLILKLDLGLSDLLVFFLTLISTFVIGFLCHILVEKKNSKIIKFFIG